MATEILLIATANQSGDNLVNLGIELQGIRDAELKQARLNGCVDTQELNAVTYASLSDKLSLDTGQAITMLHYIGHSGAAGIWVEWGSQPGVIPDEALAGLFSRRTFRLVFLNSCSSKDIAQTLLRAGVHYVIGTGTAINDTEAMLVARKFYELLGNLHDHRTIQQAFDDTRTFFENYQPGNLQTAFAQDASRRGALQTTDPADSATFPWQLYSRDDLTDAQRNWQLVPKDPPTETNELWRISPLPVPGSAFTPAPLQFFVSFEQTDLAIRNELLNQLYTVFNGFGDVEPVWDDTQLVDNAADRLKQVIDQMNAADFVYLLVNATYPTNAITKPLLDHAKDWFAAKNTAPAQKPYLLVTADNSCRAMPATVFNVFPRSGRSVSSNRPLPDACREFCKLVMFANWQKIKLKQVLRP